VDDSQVLAPHRRVQSRKIKHTGAVSQILMGRQSNEGGSFASELSQEARTCIRNGFRGIIRGLLGSSSNTVHVEATNLILASSYKKIREESISRTFMNCYFLIPAPVLR
jgi:hypothetical protein